MFIQRCLHNVVAVKGNLSKFINTIDLSCPLCEKEMKTIDHFFNCKFSQLIRFGSPLGLRTQENRRSFKDWIGDQGLGIGASYIQTHAFSMGAFIIRSIRKLEMIKSSTTLPLPPTPSFIKKSGYSMNTSIHLIIRKKVASMLKLRLLVLSPCHVHGLLHCKAISNLMCTNVYEATRTIGAAVTIARNQSDTFIEGFSKFVHGGTVEEMEVQGFLLGLQLAAKFGCQGTIIEGDYQLVIKLLFDDNNQPPWRIAKIIQDCWSLLNLTIVVSFVPRIFNNVAHHMASVVAKEQVEGSQNSKLTDDVLKYIIML